jgi:DNA-directed RNA polymerase specialized sigma24 family protein
MTGAAHDDALDAVYRRERTAMVRMATLIVGSRVRAEEIVQDAFMAMADRASELERPGGYLRTTVVNGCRMALRRRAVEQRYALVVEDRALGGDLDELVALRDALARLPERARIAVVLRYLVDLPDGRACTPRERCRSGREPRRPPACIRDQRL